MRQTFSLSYAHLIYVFCKNHNSKKRNAFWLTQKALLFYSIRITQDIRKFQSPWYGNFSAFLSVVYMIYYIESIYYQYNRSFSLDLQLSAIGWNSKSSVQDNFYIPVFIINTHASPRQRATFDNCCKVQLLICSSSLSQWAFAITYISRRLIQSPADISLIVRDSFND